MILKKLIFTGVSDLHFHFFQNGRMDRDTQKLVQEAPALPEKTGPPPDFPLSYPTGVQVISMPPTTVQQNDVRFSWGTLVTAIVSFFCCSLCGFPATVLAVLAHADHKVNNYKNITKCYSMNQ